MDLVKLLKFQCDTYKYKEVRDESTALHYTSKLSYWDILPRYDYACCPFCGRRYSGLIDTYSISNNKVSLVDLVDSTQWGIPKRLNQASQISPCKHFLGIHRFVNLHKNILSASDFSYREAGLFGYRFEGATSEVPYITAGYFGSSNIPAFAVLHTLPICRIVDDVFVPTFSLFIITYFSASPAETRDGYYKLGTEHNKPGLDYFGSNADFPKESNSIQYDLASWTKKGVLGWMDFTRPELSLRIGKDEQLPVIYRSIEGNRRPYLIKIAT